MRKQQKKSRKVTASESRAIAKSVKAKTLTKKGRSAMKEVSQEALEAGAMGAITGGKKMKKTLTKKADSPSMKRTKAKLASAKSRKKPVGKVKKKTIKKVK